VSYLLDTNIVSEVRRRRPDAGVLQWFDGVAASDLFVSVLTIGELRRGVVSLRRRDGRAADSLNQWLSGLVSGYGDRVVGVDAAVADRSARVNVPDPLPVVDGLLAATALVHGWTLVTRNTGDVERSGVAVVNPFRPT